MHPHQGRAEEGPPAPHPLLAFTLQVLLLSCGGLQEASIQLARPASGAMEEG